MAKIKFDHAVIYNGVFYPANTEIEAKEPKLKEPEKKAVAENDERTGSKPKSRNRAD